MKALFKTAALALAGTATLATAMPAEARDHRRDRYEQSYRYDRYNRGYSNHYAYGEPAYRNTRVWRGRDGNVYCQKKDGTTGLIIGAAAGALLGREVDGGYDRTLGTVLGAAAGALLGKEVTGGTRCR